MHIMRPISILTIAASLVIGAQAHAKDSCNGAAFSGKYFENRTNIYYAGGEHLETEKTTFTVSGNFQSLSIKVSGSQTGTLCSSAASCNGYVFTAPATGTYNFEITGRGGTGIGPGLTPTGPLQAGTVSSSCQAASTGVDEDADQKTSGSGSGSTTATATSNSSSATGGASIGAIGNAVNGATSGNGGLSGTRNALTFSSAGAGALADGAWNFWGAASVRAFDGNVDGQGVELTFGGGKALGQGQVGFLVSYGDYDLTASGTAVTTKALSFGPYARVDISDKLSVSGFVTYAQPDYTVAGTSFDATRWSGGLRATTTYRVGGIELSSFVSAEGFSESHPVVGTTAARSITQLVGSLGTKATLTPDAALRPYVSLAGAFSRFDDGLGTKTDHLSPRIGAGMVFDEGPGVFELHLDGGEILDGTRDYGLSARYSLDF